MVARSKDGFDAVVIGSGMGGMTTAAALSRLDHIRCANPRTECPEERGASTLTKRCRRAFLALDRLP
jgi:2-polyprenyl-6-methoxyphenol hydroxylase-like FAD-dependent oxidoreductase